MVSVVYTYAIIIQAAKVTQASERWCGDEKIVQFKMGHIFFKPSKYEEKKDHNG